MNKLSKSFSGGPTLQPSQLAIHIAVALALATTFASGNSVASSVWPVTNCGDAPDTPGTLRSVIGASTTLDNDVIDLSSLPSTCSIVTITGSEIVIAQSNLSIQGAGSDTLTLAGQFQTPPYVYHRIFDHTGSGQLKISNVTIADAKYVAPSGNAYGGCIVSSGSVLMTDSTLINCRAASPAGQYLAGGGAIYAKGGVGLVNSTVENSMAIAGSAAGGTTGGGIATLGDFNMTYSSLKNNTALNGVSSAGGAAAGGNVLINHSTISGNQADNRGALLSINLQSTPVSLQIIDSTISGNIATEPVSSTAPYVVAGVEADVPTIIANSTIAFNTSASNAPGTGLLMGEATLTLQSSIIAMNTSAAGLSDTDTTLALSVAGGDNLVTSGTGPLPPSNNACPRLSPLSNHGGRTLTHGLLTGSPAIDAGDNLIANNGQGVATDQRGLPRTVGAATDIGALELNALIPEDQIFSSEFENRCN